MNRTTITFIVGALMMLLFLQQCNKNSQLKNDLKVTRQDSDRNFNNYLATKDSIRTTIADNGSLISSIRSYEFDISNFKEDQRILVNKYKKSLNLNKDLNRVNSLLSADIVLKDSIIANVSIVKIDSLNSKLTFEKIDDFGNGNTRSINGEISIVKNDSFYKYGDPIINLTQTMKLMAAVEEVNGSNQLKISTKYPGLIITDIENINLINNKLNQEYKKKAGWSIGVGIGYGINLNNNQVISTGPSIGIGLFYSPKWLRF